MPRTKWWPARKSPPPPLRFAPDKREEAANGLPDRYRLSTSQAATRWRSCGACPGPPDPRRPHVHLGSELLRRSGVPTTTDYCNDLLQLRPTATDYHDLCL